MRLAYGYAQYGYAQRKNFSLAPTRPASGPGLLVISPRPYCYCAVTISPGSSHGACALAFMSTSAGSQAHTMCFRAEVPGGREPDKENATYVAFGRANQAVIATVWLPGPRGCKGPVAGGR